MANENMNHRILKLVPKKPESKKKAKARQDDIDPKIMKDIRIILKSNNPLVINGFKQTLSAYKHCYEVGRRDEDLKELERGIARLEMYYGINK